VLPCVACATSDLALHAPGAVELPARSAGPPVDGPASPQP
jgi:hypothetical protein